MSGPSRTAKESAPYRERKALKRTAARAQRERSTGAGTSRPWIATTAERLPTPGGGPLAVKVCATPTCYGVTMVRAGDSLPTCPRCGAGEMGRNGIAGAEGAVVAAKGRAGR